MTLPQVGRKGINYKGHSRLFSMHNWGDKGGCWGQKFWKLWWRHLWMIPKSTYFPNFKKNTDIFVYMFILFIHSLPFSLYLYSYTLVQLRFYTFSDLFDKITLSIRALSMRAIKLPLKVLPRPQLSTSKRSD